MELSCNNDLCSRVMATANFHKFSSSVDICLSHPTDPSDKDVNIVLQRREAFTKGSSFAVPLRNGLTESFQWRNSRGVEVASLNGWWQGKKLVRETTGQVVAAWTFVDSGWRTYKKMAWIAAPGGQDHREELGIWFELASVMTCVVMIELKKREQKHAAAVG
jgi:hypothetical protein